MTETLWIFGYGSLIWNPGFTPTETVLARAQGWHRSFCMRSIHHRGTVASPGLVLALDAATAASCAGVAFAVAPEDRAQVMADLRARELVSAAYLERTLPVDLVDGRQVAAVTYVIDPDHDQYCGGLPPEAQAQIIAGAAGGRGPNRDYLWATAQHLRDLGIADPDLDWLDARVRALVG